MPKISESSTEPVTTETSGAEGGTETAAPSRETPSFSFELPPFPSVGAGEPTARSPEFPKDPAPLAGFELPPLFSSAAASAPDAASPAEDELLGSPAATGDPLLGSSAATGDSLLGSSAATGDSLRGSSAATGDALRGSSAATGDGLLGSSAASDDGREPSATAGYGDDTAPDRALRSDAPQATPAPGADTPAHLQLPTFDFSLPPLGSASGTAPAPAAGDAPADVPPHLHLPTFPQFELPPVPGETPAGEPTSGAADTGAAAPPPLRAPGAPPPPPRRRPKAQEPAAMELPSIVLPDLAAESPKKELTLLRAEAAAELEELPARKRPVLPFLAVAALLAAGTGAFLERDAIVGAIAARDPQPVVETAESKALALYAAGQEAYTKKQIDVAAAKYEAALSALPKFAKAHRALAIARAKQNRRDEAVEHYRAYLNLEPKAPDAAEVRKIIEDYEKSKGAAASSGKTAESKRRRRR